MENGLLWREDVPQSAEIEVSIYEPEYLRIARRDIGLREIKGPQHNSRIVGWLAKFGAWWRNDEEPWCGTAMAGWMSEAGIAIPKVWYRALAWAEWGQPCAVPALGCVAVLTRSGGGHVGLVTGISPDRSCIRVLGGNQNNMVCESWFQVSRVTAYRLPPGGVALPAPLAAIGTLSSSEA